MKQREIEPGPPCYHGTREAGNARRWRDGTLTLLVLLSLALLGLTTVGLAGLQGLCLCICTKIVTLSGFRDDCL